MKPSFTGKTIFVPRHCLDEVEKLIGKRRRQRFIWGLSCLCSDGDEETKHLKATIDANCAKPISIEDCAAMIVRSYAVIPKLARTLADGRTAYGRDYLAIYNWYVGGQKCPPMADKITSEELSKNPKIGHKIASENVTQNAKLVYKIASENVAGNEEIGYKIASEKANGTAHGQDRRHLCISKT